MFLSLGNGSLPVTSKPSGDENSSNSISTLNHNTTYQNDFQGNTVDRQSVYVCTFCQVFSPYKKTVIDHISSEHNNAFPLGSTAENFVSKLQALQNIKEKKTCRKIGRPKKCEKQSSKQLENELPSVDPCPGPDGLYWCQKCHRFFKKSRQLSRHICHEIDEDSFSDENSVETDESTNFRMYAILDPIPWSRMCKNRSSKNNAPVNLCASQYSANETHKESVDKILSKSALDWRSDPSYVPLFKNEDEKLAFEKHLRSVDYSWVDNMFVKEEKGRKKKIGLAESAMYSCSVCKKVLKSLSHIRMHCLIHTDIKPFTCPKCPYRTNAKGSLYSHMRKHTGNIFKCSQCNFQSVRRAHILDHEATHSSISQFCRLCKNSYKTLKSLIAHVRKYHNNAGGRKYLKSLSSKQGKEMYIKCSVCQKKFKSSSSFQTHNEVFHAMSLAPIESRVEDHENMLIDNMENIPADLDDELDLNKSLNIPQPDVLECQNDVTAPKASLAAIVLNNFLQQKSSESVICENIFEQPQDQEVLSSSSSPLLRNFQAERLPEALPSLNDDNQFHPKSSILVECEKTLGLDILDECLQHPNFTGDCITANCHEASRLINAPLTDKCHQQFSLPEVNPSFTDEAILQKDLGESQNVSEVLAPLHEKIAVKKCLDESKSAEIKLFEKCHRAPAYVCCVCSAIYICPSTLKVHLKEHVYSTSSSLIEQPEEDFDPAKISETDNELDNVCGILPDTCDEKELEKLYTSSLDMIWYLPEVSVVLENDPALFDSMLDDISNFPINEKYDESEDLTI